MHTLHVRIFSTLPSHPRDIAIVYFTYLYMIISQHTVAFIILNQHLAFKPTKNRENKRFFLHFIFLWSSTFFFFFGCVCVFVYFWSISASSTCRTSFNISCRTVLLKTSSLHFSFLLICPRKSSFLLHFGRMLFLDIELYGFFSLKI